MADKDIETKLDRLTDQITILTNQLSKQNARLAALENALAGIEADGHAMGAVSAGPDQVPEDQAILPVTSSWAGSGSFLARLAAICFILVIALVLRTLTDSGIIGAKAGSMIGTGYAALLIAIGWKLLRAGSGLGPIFPVCGALLMFSLILETHARFAAYTTVTAYTILFFTLLPLAIMGRRYQRSLFPAVGLIGAACTAFALDFPVPFFPQLAFFLLAINVVAYLQVTGRARWVQAVLYAMTITFWYLWALKLHAPMVKGIETTPEVALSWYLPMTLATVFILMGFSVYRSYQHGDALSLFDIALPTINVLWLYPACSLVVIPLVGDDTLLGYGGLALAIVHFLVAGAIFRFSRHGGPGICAYVFAGATLMVMATLAAVENILPALPLWGAVAVILSFASRACEIGGIRLTSYLLQVVATILGIGYGVLLPGTPDPMLATLAAGALAVMSAFQYTWSRQHPLACSVGFFKKVDPMDHTAILLLLTALVDGFLMLQLVAYDLLASSADPVNALLGAQSVFINLGAMGLMIYGLMKRQREILYTSIGIVVLGAFKALGYDLFKAHGVPLVLSVFSFGAVAAVGSVVFSRWSQVSHRLGQH